MKVSLESRPQLSSYRSHALGEFTELDIRKRFFVSSDRVFLPAGTLVGPLTVPALNSKWGLFELRIVGAGPFHLPQLLVASDSDEEQNIPVPLKLISSVGDGSSLFAAPVSVERLSKSLYVIPSLKQCSAEKIETRVTPLTRIQVAKVLMKVTVANPRLLIRSATKHNVGYRFQPWPERFKPGAVVRSVVELASRNFPNPDELRFGVDPDYTLWINGRYETLIPRTRLHQDLQQLPLVAVIDARRVAQMDQPLSATLNALYSAGFSKETIFVIKSDSGPTLSRGNTFSESQVLLRLSELPARTFLLNLRAGDTVSRDVLDLCRQHVSPQTSFVYFDHDHASDDGTLFDYEFKPDNSPNTLIFRNYASRTSMARLSLLFDLIKTLPDLEAAGFEGLMYASAIKASQDAISSSVIHIPVPAIHLMASSSDEMCATSAIERKARDLQLTVYAPELVIEQINEYGGIRWRCKTPPKASVSILIPTKNRIDLVKPAIESILTLTDYKNYEIVIIDNQSDDKETVDYLYGLANEGLAEVKAFDREFNFSKMHNQVIPELNSDYVLLMNNDTEVFDPSWLVRLVELFDLPNIGIVGNKLLYPDGTVQHAGATGGLRGPMAHHLVGRQDKDDHRLLSFPRDVLAVTAACMLMPRHLYLASGGMDESLAISYNDMDLCLSVRVNMGKAVVISSSGGVIHKESKSRGTSFSPEQQESLNKEADYFEAKWEHHIRPDPFYNPNLSLDQDFTLQ